MDYKRIKKYKLTVFICFSSFILTVGLCLCSYQSKSLTLINYQYDIESGCITFSIDDKCELFSLTSKTGNATIPAHNGNTKQLVISLWKIPEARNDFLHFILKDQVSRQYHFEFELNHSSKSFIEALDYPYANGRMIRQYVDCKCGLHKN